ncbi:MAG: hypothetical protein ACJ75G_12230 [Gaiellaceae bacterium]
MAEPAAELASRVDWTALSAQSKETLRTVVVLVACGYEYSEISPLLGLSTHAIRGRVAMLRAELREQIERS